MDKSKAIEKEEFWRLAIREHLESGLTARSFCQREGLSESLFYAWRKKIQQQDDILEVPQRVAADRLVPVRVVAKSSQIRQQAELPKQTHLPIDEFSMSRFEVLTPCGFTVRTDESIEPVERQLEMPPATIRITGSSTCPRALGGMRQGIASNCGTETRDN